MARRIPAAEGRHRAQAPKPAQAGPSLPREVDEVARLRVSGLEALAHITTLTQSPTTHGYWWSCTCGDAGGPYEHYGLRGTPPWRTSGGPDDVSAVWGHGARADPVSIGQAMRRLREGRGLTLRAMADRLGYSPAYISDLELGRRRWSPLLRKRYAREAAA